MTSAPLARPTLPDEVFLAALVGGVLALAVAGVLFATTCGARPMRGSRRRWSARHGCSRRLSSSARSMTFAAGTGRAEAGRSGALIAARVTFIARRRPRRRRLRGNARRHRRDGEPRGAARSGGRQRPAASVARSATAPRFDIDMLYVGAGGHPAIAFVRVALPLTDVRAQLRPVLTATRPHSASRWSAAPPSPGCYRPGSASASGRSRASPSATDAAT